METIDFAKNIEADRYSLSVFAPYYGSKFYNILVDSGVGFNENCWEIFYHQSPVPLVNNVLSKKVIEQYFALNDFGKKEEKKNDKFRVGKGS